jgi:hypothetical protein
MEMFSDGKLNQRLERYMSRKEMKDFTESLDDEGER